MGQHIVLTDRKTVDAEWLVEEMESVQQAVASLRFELFFDTPISCIPRQMRKLSLQRRELKLIKREIKKLRRS